MVLTAHLEGFESLSYTVRWQYSPDGGRTVVDAGTGTTHHYTADANNANWLWRVIVEVDD